MFKVKKIFSALVGAAMAANVFMTMPFSAFADEETAHTYTYNGYEVSYDVTYSWGNTEIVSVTLSNTGDSAIENWMLYFDPNGQVHDTVNVQEMQTSAGITYFKNSGYNATVNPDSSVSFSYMVDDCEAIPDDFMLCQTRTEKESGYQVSLMVNQTWGDSFNGEIIIQNNTDQPIEAWELTVDTNFTITEITNSWAATVTELESYSYMLKGTYTGTIPASSSVSLGFNGVKSGEPVITDYSLTEVVVDEGLFESSELTNAMVDGSSVNDKVYAEALYDSENENIDISWSATASGISFEVYISDNNKDYELYETVNENTFNSTYHITDEFLIKYIKIKQTLDDENIIYSNICYAVYAPIGVEWTEYQRKWDIPNSDELLSAINTESNPYDLSLEFDAAGIPDIHLNVSESSYTNAIDNDYILGTAPEFNYKDDLSISDITVKFQISDNFLENELGTLENNPEFAGIKRFNIFKYFEDINILLPIETKFDLTNNIVYTEVNELGTYCIVDMEKWLNQFNVDVDKLNTSSAIPSVFSLSSDESEVASVNTFVSENSDVNAQDNSDIILTDENVIDMDAIQTFSEITDPIEENEASTETSDEPIEVVFVLQSAGETGSYYSAEKEMILDAAEKIFASYVNTRIYVIGFKHNEAYFLKNDDSEVNYFSSRAEMNCINDYEYEQYGGGYVNRSPAYEMLTNNIIFRENSKNFVFTLYNGSTDCQGVDQIEICRSLDINYSELLTAGLMYANTERASNVLDEVIKSNGICIMYDENSANVIYNHICDNMELETPEPFEDKIYFGMDWNEVNSNVSLQVNGDVDSDNDGLTDWEEINSAFFENSGIVLNDGEYITEEQLPSAWYMLKSKYGCIPFRYLNSNNFKIFDILNQIKVLPVISNPMRESSADDGINDFDKLKPECVFDKYKSNYYDENGKYYSYYDDSDYYYEHLEERYKQKDAFKAYTVESLFPELKDNSLNNKSNSTYLEVSGNDITINARIMFWDEFDGTENEREIKIYNEPARNYLTDIEDGDDRTVREIIIYGLEYYWQKSFEGSIFDFYPGMKINTYVNIQDDTGLEGYSYNTEPHDDELYVVVSSDNGASYMLPNYMRINVNTYPTVTTNLARGAAHEFGHILGLFDYYSNAGNEVPVINKVQLKSEIKADGLMNSAKLNIIDTVPNDIEMVLYGSIDNTFSCSQRFIPERKNENIPKGQEKISSALREKIAYANLTPHPSDDVIDSCIKYEWAEEKYFIPVNSEIKTNEFFKYAKGDECAVIIDVAEGFENVETLEIPSTIDGVSVVKISNYAFENQNSLKSIALPNGIIDIGYSAFENCTNLAEANLPEQLQYIRQNAFKNCALKEIETFSDVKRIDNSAFEGCDFLESITVDSNNKFYYSEDGVLFSYDVIYYTQFTTLVKYPAANDRKEYTIPDNVIKFENNAFRNCSNLTSLTIPKSVKEMSESSFNNCNSLEFIDVDNDNSIFSSVDGVLFNKEKTKLIQYPTGNKRTEYQMPNGIVEIGDSAFNSCHNLTNITLPNSVEKINAYAFNDCQNLTDFTIPENVKFIGFLAFSGCRNIGDIEIPESVKKIDAYAFNLCWYWNEGTVKFKRKADFEYNNSMFWNDFSVSIYIPFDAKDNYTKDDETIIFEHAPNDKVSFYN